MSKFQPAEAIASIIPLCNRQAKRAAVLELLAMLKIAIGEK